MSATAEATHVCEICGDPVDPTGGRRSLWCARHQAAGRRKAKRAVQARYQARRRAQAPPDPPDPRTCRGCHARLLEPSPSGMCRFCEIEVGLITEADLPSLEAGADRLSTTGGCA